MDNLVERLRKNCFLKATHPHLGNIADDCMEAADRIRELEAENKLALVCTKELQGDCIYYSSKLETLITELRDIQTDVHKLNDLLRWNVDGWDAPESIVYAASGLSAKLTALLDKHEPENHDA